MLTVNSYNIWRDCCRAYTVYRGNVVGIFTSDTTVVTMGSAISVPISGIASFAGIHFSFSGYFAACGKSYIGFLHNIISITFVRVPGSYLASKYFTDTLYPMGLAARRGHWYPWQFV